MSRLTSRGEVRQEHQHSRPPNRSQFAPNLACPVLLSDVTLEWPVDTLLSCPCLRPLPVISSQASEDPPLYDRDLVKDLGVVSRNLTAETVTGGLSFPQKMDVPAWGISATRCHVGSVLAKEPNTVCRSCYALKGTFRAPP